MDGNTYKKEVFDSFLSVTKPRLFNIVSLGSYNTLILTFQTVLYDEKIVFLYHPN